MDALSKTPDPRGVTVMNTKIIIICSKQNGIQAKPENALTRVEDTLEFFLRGGADTTVTISGKENYPGSEWIQGTGTVGGSFTVPIPPDLDIPERPGVNVYGYNIDVAGVGMLDPLVTVRR